MTVYPELNYRSTIKSIFDFFNTVPSCWLLSINLCTRRKLSLNYKNKDEELK